MPVKILGMVDHSLHMVSQLPMAGIVNMPPTVDTYGSAYDMKMPWSVDASLREKKKKKGGE